MTQAPLAVRRLGPDASLREIVRQDMLRRELSKATDFSKEVKPRA